MPGDDDAAAPPLDTGLHNPDLPSRRVDPKPGSALSNRMVSLPPGLLSRARRGVRSTVGMVGSSFTLFAASGQGRMDAVRHPVGGGGNGPVGQVDIALRGLDQGVTEELRDRHHVQAVHGRDGCPAMAKVVQPQSGQARLVANAGPLVLDIVDVPHRRTGNRGCIGGWRR